MTISNLQDALGKKLQRQQALFKKYPDAFSITHGGTCFAKGSISPGCAWCFNNSLRAIKIDFAKFTDVPGVCNCSCPFCFEVEKQTAQAWRLSEKWNIPGWEKKRLLKDSYAGVTGLIYNFTSANSEPLLYINGIIKYMTFFRQYLEPKTHLSGHAKVYTNGVCLDKEMISTLKAIGMDEVRVNVSAAGFSDRVYDNLAEVIKHIPTVAVEVPVWPPYKEKLFAMLPRLQQIGVKYLNLDQIEIRTKEAFEKMSALLPADTVAYMAGWRFFLNDDGLVEDLLEKTVKKGYAFSVLDCNSLIHNNVAAYHDSFAKGFVNNQT